MVTYPAAKDILEQLDFLKELKQVFLPTIQITANFVTGTRRAREFIVRQMELLVNIHHMTCTTVIEAQNLCSTTNTRQELHIAQGVSVVHSAVTTFIALTVLCGRHQPIADWLQGWI